MTQPAQNATELIFALQSSIDLKSSLKVPSSYIFLQTWATYSSVLRSWMKTITKKKAVISMSVYAKKKLRRLYSTSGSYYILRNAANAIKLTTSQTGLKSRSYSTRLAKSTKPIKVIADSIGTQHKHFCTFIVPPFDC